MPNIPQKNQDLIIKTAQELIINRGWAVIPATLSRNEDGSKRINVQSDYWNKSAEKGLDDPYEVPEVFKNKNALGIVTGYRSGITVIDIDVDKDPTSPTYGKPYTDPKVFPETYTVKTQSGGFHLYYQYYQDITNKADVGGESYKKIDCRNDGGFVFAPPSEIDGEQAYQVLNDIEPQPFPSEMFKGIKEAKKSTAKFKGGNAIKAFINMEEGERDSALFAYAENAYRTTPMKHWPNADLTVWILSKQMKNPLPETQVSKIMNSAKRYHMNDAKELELATDSKGNPKLELKNVIAILKNDDQFKGRVRANTFAGTIEYKTGNEWNVIKKSNETQLRVELAEKYEFMGAMPKSHVEDAIAMVATEREVSPIADYFNTLIWDQKPRLEKWISKVYHIEDNVYHQELGHHYLVGLVNRVLRPGCQMDNAIVLDGAEGFGKSQSLRALCDFPTLGLLFNETSESPDGKDFAIGLLGSVITEFAEGAVFDYRDRKKVKSFMSKTHDKYRPPYERSALDFPRQGVFAMSTNDSQYLEDRGINRRWWPIVIDRDTDRKANIAWLEDNKEQMYAEAVAKQKENYWEFSKEAQSILTDIREEKSVEDETYSPLFEWYLSLDDLQRETGISKLQGWKKLDMKKDYNDFELKKIGEYYTNVLHLKQVRRKIKGVTARVFVPTKRTPDAIPELVESNYEINNF